LNNRATCLAFSLKGHRCPVEFGRSGGWRCLETQWQFILLLDENNDIAIIICAVCQDQRLQPLGHASTAHNEGESLRDVRWQAFVVPPALATVRRNLT
jgi:hypothetical protein